MTQETYQKTKDERKALWLERVFAHGTENEEETYKEAVEKFENEYPKFIQ